MTACDILEWDSAFFGRSIARYRRARCTAAEVDELSAECAARGIECVYVLIDPSDTDSIVALDRAGAFFADTRVTLEARIDAPPRVSCQPPGTRIRAATASDLPGLKHLATISHRGTRFYSDPHFPPDLCARLYETWIEKSCNGYADVVIVAEVQDAGTVGYVTCHKGQAGRGRIGLFAVADGHQGRGIGASLMAAALSWCADNGVTTMTVATQLQNTRAVRVYERAGLTLNRAEFWFHYWSSASAC